MGITGLSCCHIIIAMASPDFNILHKIGTAFSPHNITHSPSVENAA